MENIIYAFHNGNFHIKLVSNAKVCRKMSFACKRYAGFHRNDVFWTQWLNALLSVTHNTSLRSKTKTWFSSIFGNGAFHISLEPYFCRVKTLCFKIFGPCRRYLTSIQAMKCIQVLVLRYLAWLIKIVEICGKTLFARKR